MSKITKSVASAVASVSTVTSIRQKRLTPDTSKFSSTVSLTQDDINHPPPKPHFGIPEHLVIEYEQDDNLAKAPKNWLKQYEGIAEMRNAGPTAAVDIQGAHCLGDPNAPRSVWEFQILVGLMLSSQTKDPITAAAMYRLKEHGLTVKNMIDTPEKEIGELIYGVLFHNTKAKNIKKVSMILQKEHNSRVPESYEDLLKLPGIGPKMGNLAMQIIWDQIKGISVDTHVHRISGRLHWTKNAKNPVDSAKQLQKWLPKSLWKEVNPLLVGFGQTICSAKVPQCEKCQISKICPSYKAQSSKSSKSKKKAS